MKTPIQFILTFIAFWLWIYGYTNMAANIHGTEEQQIAATNAWALCDSIAKSLFIFAFVMMTTGYFREWLTFIFLLSINNLLDETFFNPYQLGWNEWLIAAVFVGYYAHKITKGIYATKQ